MKYTELHCRDDIFKVLNNHWHMNDDSVLPPMFHGTDSSLIDISEKDRKIINEACEIIIKTVYKLFRESSISITNHNLIEVKNSYTSAADYYAKAGGRINDNPLYRYGDFYVTNDPSVASGYSKEAWILGETGATANMLIEGAYKLGFDLPNNEAFISAYEILQKRKLRPKAPVILVVTDCLYSELYTMGGIKILNDGNEYYPNLINELKSKGTRYSYRIGRSSLEKDAVVYLVKPNQYQDLIDIYESISFI